MLSIDQINAMSPEDRAATNRRLAKQAIGQHVLMHTVKWIAIIGTTRVLRKALTK